MASRKAPAPSTERSRADLYIGSPHVAGVLVDELTDLGARSPSEIAPGVVAVDPAPSLLDPAFARQVHAASLLVEARNANDLAGAILDAHDAAGGGAVDEGSFTGLQVTLPEQHRRGSRALDVDEHPLARARVELDDLLRKKLAGRRAKHGGPPVDAKRALRVILVDTWRAWASLGTTAPTAAPALLAWPSPFPAGRALDEAARDAPSSAHRKLDEALAWLETGPGADDIVLDLGAAPGGWSWAALQRGARVIAVDRADLDEAVARHPKLEHVRADAFKYVPELHPTWVLCDVIATPDRSLAVVERALASRYTRGLVVTLKLKQPAPLDIVKRARALSRATPGFFGRTKNLAANKLELTVMMRRA